MSKYLARLSAKIQEKPLPHELSKLPKVGFDSFDSTEGSRVPGIYGRPEPDDVELEERKAMAMASAPEPYLDAWARLQCQKPMRVSDADWQQAIEAAGRFLDKWGSLAVEFQWTPADLFDVPRDGRPGGLVWFLNGETVRALGPEHAVTEGERIFDLVTRADWINPYQKGEHR